MKKKNIGKLARGILAGVLGISILAGGLYMAAPVLAGSTREDVADNRTLNSWDTQYFAQSTKNIGRIWTDKSVSADSIELRYGEVAGKSITKTADSDFLVALSAMSSTSTLTTTQSSMLDIVMVLDVSGSMDQTMYSYTYTEVYNLDTDDDYYIQLEDGSYQSVSYSNGGNGGTRGWRYGPRGQRVYVTPKTGANDTNPDHVQFYSRVRADEGKKLAALKAAATSFVEKIDELNQTLPADRQHRIGLVKFADDEYENVGNDMSGSSNYTQIVRTLGNYDAQMTIDAINDLKHGGPTRASYGLNKAAEVLEDARQNAQKVVIFFTDGEPNGYSGFWQSEASNAVDKALEMKQQGTLVFSIGVVANGNVEEEPDEVTVEGSIEGSTNINYFLHAISSNYPEADGEIEGSAGSNSRWTLTPGPRDPKGAYYKVVDDTQGLNTAFDNIFTEITTLPAAPTYVESGDPQSGGYVTFTDTLGQFMEVKDANAIVYNDRIYTAHEKQTAEDGQVSYVFTDNVTDVNQAFPGTYSLNKMVITVVPGATPAQGDTVTVKVPAALLPLMHYDVDKDGTLAITEAHPVRVLYSVGLKAGVDTAMQTGRTHTVEGLTEYIRTQSKDGKINFYSNAWSDPQKGGTVVTFTPASTNQFYFFTENSPLFTDAACTQPLKTTPVDGATYWYQHTYYSNELGNPDNTEVTTSIAVQHEEHMTAYLAVGTDGVWYAPAGIRRSSMSNDPSMQIPKLGADDENVGGTADVNATGTAAYALFPTWGSGGIQNYLGNNGRISYTTTGSLAISKTVTADEGLTAPASAEFTFQVKLGGQDLAGIYATELYTVGSPNVEEGSVTVSAAGTATVKLKADQTLTIFGLPAGTSYEVTETNVPKGFTQVDPGQAHAGTIVLAQTNTEAFTNHYAVQPVEVGVHYPVSKVVKDANNNTLDWKGKSWSFDFVLSGVTPGAPMPTYNRITIDEEKEELCFGFEDTQFTKPGVYSYTITEVLPTTEASRIPGINYSKAVYRLEITVTDNGDGTMKTAGRLLLVVRDDNTVSNPPAEVEHAAFTNIYQLGSISAGPRAHKVLVDNSGGRTLKAGEFSFSINPVGSNASEAPAFNPNVVTNTQSGLVNFGQTTFTQEHVGKTFIYELREVIPAQKEAGMKYAEEFYRIEISVKSRFNDSGEAEIYYTAVHTDKDGKVIASVDAQGNPIVGFMPFTNTYTPESVQLSLGVQKTLKGRDWTADDQFDFTVTALNGAPAPAAANAAVTLASGKTASFGAITFTKVGTYKYEITETVPAQTNGITYDVHKTVATVTVTDNGGQLAASVVYDNTTAADTDDRAVTGIAAFTNTYRAQEVTMTPSQIKVGKILTGRDWKETDNFIFDIWGDGRIPVPVMDEVSIDWVSRNTVTDFDSQNLTYTAAGVYDYYITEKTGVINGITYDRHVYRVRVTIADNGLGNLEVASVVYAKSNEPLAEGVEKSLQAFKALTYTETAEQAASFENIYKPNSVDVTIRGVKIFRGRDMKAGESFTFTLANTGITNGVTMGGTTASVSGLTAGQRGEFAFDAISFTEPGQYTFTITETEGSIPYVTYDTHPCTVLVDVTDNHAGQLEAKVTYEHGGYAIFGNAYYNEQEAKDVTVGGQSVDGKPVSAGEILTYTIDWVNTKLDETGLPAMAEITIIDTIPENTELVADSISNGGVYADGAITWKITAAQVATGSVSFQVKVEENLTDGAEITNWATVNGVQTNVVTTYVPGKTADKISGVQVGDVLTYTLTFFNNKGDGASVTVSDTLVEALTYVPTDNGASYDAENRTITWNLTNVTAGWGSVTFKAQVNEKALEQNITNQAAVDNTYTTNILDIQKPAKGQLTISKTVTGEYAPADAMFQFRVNLKMKDDAGTPLAGSYPYTVSNGVTGSIKDGDVIFLMHGESAVITGLPMGVQYSVTEINIPDGFKPEAGTLTGEVGEATTVGFKNTFTPAVLSGETALQVAKQIVGEDGQTPENWPDGWKFKFRIASARQDVTVPLPANTEVVVSKDAPAGHFGNITFTQTGEYHYVIIETHPTDGRHVGLDYSQAVYLVTVTVTPGDGKLDVSSEMKLITDHRGAAVANPEVVQDNVAVFNNLYDLATASWAPSVRKQIHDESNSNKHLHSGDFHFIATPIGDNAENAPVFSEAVNNQAGVAEFIPVIFDVDDVNQTYIYEIKETNEEINRIPGWRYSDQVYYAHVSVGSETVEGSAEAAVVVYVKYTDKDGNELKDENDEPIDELLFTNTYAPEAATAAIQVQKVLENRDWLADETFDFTLIPINNAPMNNGAATDVLTVVNGEVASFQSITYSKVGQYYYEVKENAPAEDENGLIYDRHTAYIVVNVTDDGGKLKAAVDYGTQGALKAVFTNIYDNGIVVLPSDELMVEKVLDGRSWLNTDRFTFTITGSDGAPMPENTTVTLDVNSQKGSFGTIIFDDDSGDGYYVYTITEDNGSIPSIQYDGKSYTVKVKVEDDQSGNLSITEVKHELAEAAVDSMVFTNTYSANTDEANAAIQVVKQLNGRSWNEGESFSFQITPQGDAPAAEQDTVTVTSVNTTGRFQIHFQKAGVYQYQIREIEPSEHDEKLFYDRHTAMVTVTVRDDFASGKLIPSVSYNNGADNDTGAALFTNVYYDVKEAKSVSDSTVSIDGQPVSAGQILTYTVKWANTAGNVADVTVTDVIPASTTVEKFLEGTPSNWDPSTRTLTWVLKNQPIGAEGVVKFQVKVREDLTNATEIVNVAHVNHAETNQVVNSLPGKDIDQLKAVLGETRTYTVSYKNTTGQTADVHITDTLDQNLTYVEGSADNGGVYTAEDRTIRWTISGVGAGESGSVTFEAQLNAMAIGDEDGTPNYATVQIGDHHATTNVVTIPKLDTADMTITKTVVLTPEQGTQIDAGRTFTFTVVLEDEAGIALPGQYEYTVNGVAEGKTIASGGILTLHHGDAVVIKNLPNGTNYTVTESQDAQGYTCANPVITGNAPTGADFVNTYTVTGCSAELKASKSLLDPNGTPISVPAGMFSFSAYTTYDGVVPVAGGTNGADGQVVLSKLDFAAAGSYTYYIREDVNPEAEHIHYDPSVYRAIVTIRDNGEGALVLDGIAYSTIDGTAVSEPSFINQYKENYTVGSFSLELDKLLTGRTLEAGEFTFGLYLGDELVATGTNDIAGKVRFTDVTAEALALVSNEIPDAYPVTITGENAPTAYLQLKDTDIALSEAEIALVEAGESFELKVLAQGGQISDADKAVLDAAVPGNTLVNYVNISGSKTVDGTESAAAAGAMKLTLVVEDAENRAFSLAAIRNGVAEVLSDLDGANNGTVTVMADSFGAYAIIYTEGASAEPTESALTASQMERTREIIDTPQIQIPEGWSGEKVFTLKELSTAPLGGVAYDGTQYRVKVTVHVDDQHLVASQPAFFRVDGDVETPVDVISFTNSYSADESEPVVIKASKALNGRTLKDGEFTFIVKDAQGNIVAESKNAANEIALNIGTFKQTGSFTYTVAEVAGGDETVIYDKTEFTVTVNVTDDLKGKLQAEVIYPEGGICFLNRYKTPVDFTLKAKKALEGKSLVGGEFSFLLSKNGEILSKVTNSADGAVVFEPVTFTQEGTYEFVISEEKGSTIGITYDTAVHTVKVIVETTETGALTARLAEPERIVTFTNTFTEPAAAQLKLEATKKLTGRDLKKGEFTFQILNNGQVVSQGTNTANGSIDFTAITFPKAGQYTLEVLEVKGDAERVTYDAMVYTMTVNVTLQSDNTLKAEAAYPENGIVFYNTYEEPPQSETPPTGDGAPMALLLMATLISAAGAAYILLRRRVKA